MWLIYTIWASLCFYSPIGSYPQLTHVLLGSDYFFNPYLTNIFTIAFGVGNLFDLLATTFLLIHSFSKNDQNLKIGGLIYLLGNTVLSLSVIPHYIEMFFS
jgi:hypothetical protein